MNVYILQHEHDLDGATDVKMLGVYETEHDAIEARNRLGTAPGFRDHPDGFSIDAYELGRDHWTDGFVSVPVASDEPDRQTEAA